MAKIRDPLHGTISLSDTEMALLDTFQMQRLRNIRQLAMAYLVYPGANHTRFEHSIGTLHLAGDICLELGLPSEKTEKVRAAALLHDIGHVAFSHESEAVLGAFNGTHEEIGKGIILAGEIGDLLSERFSKNEIATLVDTPLGEIITSDIGADRMDYLVRDSHYTGAAYGVIDSQRICASMSLGKSGLAIQERGLEAAESLLVARFTMFSTVYLHKTVRIASRMLQQAIMLALQDGTMEAKEALSMGDAMMLYRLSQSAEGGKYAKRIESRRLFKKAYEIPLSGKRIAPKKLEVELADCCGCEVLVDVPRLSAETHVMLETEDGWAPLSDASELVSSLVKMQKSRQNILVMCEEKNVRKVASRCEKAF